MIGPNINQNTYLNYIFKNFFEFIIDIIIFRYRYLNRLWRQYIIDTIYIYIYIYIRYIYRYILHI